MAARAGGRSPCRLCGPRRRWAESWRSSAAPAGRGGEAERQRSGLERGRRDRAVPVRTGYAFIRFGSAAGRWSGRCLRAPALPPRFPLEGVTAVHLAGYGLSTRIAGGKMTRGFPSSFFHYYCSLPSRRGRRESGLPKRRVNRQQPRPRFLFGEGGGGSGGAGRSRPLSPHGAGERVPPGALAENKEPGGLGQRAAPGGRGGAGGGGSVERRLRGALSAAEPFVRRRRGRHVVPAPRAGLRAQPGLCRAFPAPERSCPPRGRLSATGGSSFCTLKVEVLGGRYLFSLVASLLYRLDAEYARLTTLSVRFVVRCFSL